MNLGLGPSLGDREAFNPTDLPGTIAVWEANLGVTNASGDASDWKDQDVSHFVASQATAGKRPLIGANINGQPTLDFTAANVDELTNSAVNPIASGVARYVLAVVKKNATGNSTGGAVFTFRIDVTGGRVWSCQYNKFSDGNTYYFNDGVSNSVFESVPAAAPDVTTPLLIEWELTAGATPIVRINNIQRTLTGTVNATGELGTTGFRIGADRSSANPFAGSIGCVFLYTGIPATADMKRVRDYYAAKFRITLS